MIFIDGNKPSRPWRRQAQYYKLVVEEIMKKSCVVFVFAFFFLNVYLFPQDITLDEAIKNSAKEISARLERNSTIAILNFEIKNPRGRAAGYFKIVVCKSVE
jgi:hypothetical protein